VILVDTSIWIDHLHKTEAELVDLLARDEVGSHPMVLEELALGSLKRRNAVISLLSALYRFPSVSHEEILDFVDARRLWGRGLSAADVHLLGSVLLERGSRLWTRDKRLQTAAAGVGVVCL
jgi:predicted nucleic acid-binding protein